jgi:O-antigen biosynthesis protein WbqP
MLLIITRNIICLAVLMLMLPIMVFASLLIFVEDGLPIFFRQERLGKKKKIFTIYKIRTMKNDAPQLGSHAVSKNFLLKIGKYIRKIKLDEFPQLINVIIGDINLVGPRPGLVTQEILSSERDKKNIFNIKPGITGLAQILGYDMSNPKKLSAIDMIYMKKKSKYVDFMILLGTFFSKYRNQIASKLGVHVNTERNENV